jgi:hypothetical protein
MNIQGATSANWLTFFLKKNLRIIIIPFPQLGRSRFQLDENENPEPDPRI